MDIILSAGGLIILLPLFIGVAILIRLESPGPVFFVQERIGRGFRPFRLYKFRTMHQHPQGAPITVEGDPRVTRIGRFLRRTKIDELPQLINVLRGEMSLVGPRPELRRYVELFRKDYEEILKVRPGITDYASIEYVDEEKVLSSSADAEETYIKEILPHKLELSKRYVREQSLIRDIELILKTVYISLFRKGAKR